MPALIGTAVPHDHTGKRLAVAIGGTVIDAGSDDLPFIAGYPGNYFVECVRSTSNQSLIESATGNEVFLRTSDGELVEVQEFTGGVFRDVSWDNAEPLRLTSVGVNYTVRVRKTGAAWLPSDAGFNANAPFGAGESAYRVFTNGPAPAPQHRFTRSLERTFSGHPAWGGGNVQNNPAGNQRIDFVNDGTNWECWQIVPFDGPAISGVHGACMMQLRNRDKGRGSNTLEEMPSRVTLSGADWTGLPWTFTRTTNPAQFTNVAGGSSARKAVRYIADRTVAAGATAASLGIAQGESFTIEIFFD